jgi:parallel beta-helix repeat protein
VAGPDTGGLSRVAIASSTITGGFEIPSFQVGLWLDVGAAVQVRGNTISSNRCGGPGCGADPVNEGQGIGVLLLSTSDAMQIEHNEIVGNDVGITQVFSPNCCRIRNNALLDNRYFGIVIQDGDGATEGNRISGGQVGIGVVADAVDTTAVLRRDRITGTTEAPVREIECCGASARAVVTSH